MTTPHPARFRALDLSMGWAGPLLGAMLAEMNFDVVKIEDTRNFDWWRGPLNIAAPELRPIERSPTFNTVNRGKRGITLDLTDPRGVEIVKRLAAHADVAIENFVPGVMARLGLSWEVLAAVNPRLVMVSMPSFGAGGPESDARGYGNTVEAMAGVTSLNRYYDDPQPYTMSNALGDPVGGLSGTLAVLAALHERERTGRGQLVEIAQVEAVVPFLADRIIEYQFTGRVPAPLGNRHPDYAPHGIYRCAGDDAWLALAAETQEQWHGLVDALALGGLAVTVVNPTFAQKVVLTAYADTATAVCVGFGGVLGWRMLDAMARGAAKDARRLAFEVGLVMSVLVNLKQATVVLFALVIGAIAIIGTAATTTTHMTVQFTGRGIAINDR